MIDIRRFVPYAIKQIQELLGISCTFDQAIQRLAASVRMVAKGVLREHLILLASSMTCGGNLVGFNIGGYKTLAHQLNIQVPFTDATLFTPKNALKELLRNTMQTLCQALLLPVPGVNPWQLAQDQDLILYGTPKRQKLTRLKGWMSANSFTWSKAVKNQCSI